MHGSLFSSIRACRRVERGRDLGCWSRSIRQSLGWEASVSHLSRHKQQLGVGHSYSIRHTQAHKKEANAKLSSGIKHLKAVIARLTDYKHSHEFCVNGERSKKRSARYLARSIHRPRDEARRPINQREEQIDRGRKRGRWKENRAGFLSALSVSSSSFDERGAEVKNLRIRFRTCIFLRRPISFLLENMRIYNGELQPTRPTDDPAAAVDVKINSPPLARLDFFHFPLPLQQRREGKHCTEFPLAAADRRRLSANTSKTYNGCIYVRANSAHARFRDLERRGSMVALVLDAILIKFVLAKKGESFLLCSELAHLM